MMERAKTGSLNEKTEFARRGTRARAIIDLMLYGSLVLLPSCLMIEFGVWDLVTWGEDERPVSEAVRTCCHELIVEGIDYEACVDEARRDAGPCAQAVADAGTLVQ